MDAHHEASTEPLLPLPRERPLLGMWATLPRDVVLHIVVHLDLETLDALAAVPGFASVCADAARMVRNTGATPITLPDVAHALPVFYATVLTTGVGWAELAWMMHRMPAEEHLLLAGTITKHLRWHLEPVALGALRSLACIADAELRGSFALDLLERSMTYFSSRAWCNAVYGLCVALGSRACPPLVDAALLSNASTGLLRLWSCHPWPPATVALVVDHAKHVLERRVHEDVWRDVNRTCVLLQWLHRCDVPALQVAQLVAACARQIHSDQQQVTHRLRAVPVCALVELKRLFPDAVRECGLDVQALLEECAR